MCQCRFSSRNSRDRLTPSLRGLRVLDFQSVLKAQSESTRRRLGPPRVPNERERLLVKSIESLRVLQSRQSDDGLLQTMWIRPKIDV